MKTHLGLLRAVNVAGRNMVSMADLRGLITSLGYTGARTLLQSGNVIFRGEGPSGASLERLLETEAEKRLGLRTDFVVRGAADWASIIKLNPFPEMARRDPGHLVAMFMKKEVSAAAVKALQAAIVGRELVAAAGKQAYVIYPDGIGRSRLTVALIEKKLESRGTGRNWNTVLKLQALADATATAATAAAAEPGPKG